MTNDKLGFVTTPARPRQVRVMAVDERLQPDAFDNALRAQVVHIAVGVGGAGSRTVRMLIDLSVYVSLDEPRVRLKGSMGYGILLIPAMSPSDPDVVHDVHEWTSTKLDKPRWSSACTQTRFYSGLYSDPWKSAVGEPLTLRLLLDALDDRQAGAMADALCTRFTAWDEAASSLREAMAAIRAALVEPQRSYLHYMPLLYRAATVSKGWQDEHDGWQGRVSGLLRAGPTRPAVPSALSDLFARRCEAVWAEAAKTLLAPEPEPSAEGDDLAASSDAADEFVCADRMLSLWYGRRHPPRS